MDRLRRDGNRGARRALRSAWHCLLCIATCSLVACSGESILGDYPPDTCDLADPPAEFRSQTPLLVASFWPEDEYEGKAFDELFRYVNRSQYLVTKQEMRSRVEVQVSIREAFVSQQLPDAFQVNAGSDVLRWVQKRGPDSTAICALDALRDRYGWGRKYFSNALEPLTCRDKLYGLPVGIHHLNVLFYNRDLFDHLAGLADARDMMLVEPGALQSTHELLALLEQVAALDPQVVPLAIGTESQWPLTIMAFENVLLSSRPDAYETLWLGGLADDASGEREAVLRADLADMLELLRQLVKFSAQSEPITWQKALSDVGEGRALFTIMGDWGWAQIVSGAASVETAAFPGTSGILAYTPDSFAVPRDVKKDGSTAHSFLHTVIENKDALIDFSNAKHSIPPRRDLDDAQISKLATDSLRATYQRFKQCDDLAEGCKRVLAVSGLGPAPGTDPCFDQMDALLNYAVLGAAPPDEAWNGEDCDQPRPTSASKAESRLIDVLVSVARRRFADECR